jgi:EvpB/VC_A0108, tail sheath N-terminal domain/Type VI secretion system, VipA, VC_A0107 or Hcp2
MPAIPSFGRLDGGTTPPEAPSAGTPFRIALLADFSGRAAPAPPGDLSRRRPLTVDAETFDAALASLKVRLTLPELPGGPATLTPASLDDLHPDAIYQQIDRFSDLDERGDLRSFLMKGVLHHPRFRSVESAWRGADWLMRRALKGDAPVQLVLYDLTREEFVAALDHSDDLSQSPLYKWLIEQGTQGPKGQPWAVLVGDYTFDVSAAHARALGRMAKISREAAAPFLATVSPKVLGKDFAPSDKDAEAWAALRQLPEAAVLGLAAPRFLLRLPYGNYTRPVERFSFEEYTGPADRAGYQWGNPALACAAVLARAFLKDGWAARPGGSLDLGDMPMHTWRDEDGDEQATLVETWLDRKSAERLASLGVMPLLGVRGRDAVMFARLSAVAAPPEDRPFADLLGRWGQEGAVQLPRSKPSVAVKVGLGATAPAPAAPPAAPPAPAAAPRSAAQAPAAPPAEAPAAAEEEMDPELAALLGQLEADTAPAAPAAPPAEAPAAAEEEMDPELAALMKQFEEP